MKAIKERYAKKYWTEKCQETIKLKTQIKTEMHIAVDKTKKITVTKLNITTKEMGLTKLKSAYRILRYKALKIW